MKDAVVIDQGTGYIKAGLASSDATKPEIIFPSCVGRPVLRYEESFRGNDRSLSNKALAKEVEIGDECIRNRAMYEVSYPMKNGIVTDWEDMERIWSHAFARLNVLDDLSERNVLLTEAPMNPKRNRERMCEITFERFRAKGVFVHVQAVLTLYAQGLMSGLVLDCGDGVSHVVPVVDGFCNRQLTKRLDIAGRKVTERMVELLGRKGYAVSRTNDLDSIRMLKERLCFVAEDCKRHLRLARETTAVLETYELPDGRTIKVEAERFMAPEIMFSPNLIDVESPGVAELCFNCIQENDLDSRMTMYENIVLSGGSTTFPGFPERLKRDITNLYKDRILKGDETNLAKFTSRLNVESLVDRKYSVFVGGSVLADIMKDNKDFWVTKEEYEEQGIERALRKCEGSFHD